jgi:hypothetical protein
MNDLSSLPFGLVLKSDRRQISDRRRVRRGGRRATDCDGFEVFSAHAEDEELAQVVAAWGELLRFGRTGSRPYAAW